MQEVIAALVVVVYFIALRELDAFLQRHGW
jgi:hypothetical protein